jgi:hypothetical protein
VNHGDEVIVKDPEVLGGTQSSAAHVFLFRHCWTIAILILRGKSNRLADLLPLVPDLLRAIKLVHKGEISRISGDESAY